MRCQVSIVASLALCGHALGAAAIVTSPGSCGTNTSAWVGPGSTSEPNFGPFGFEVLSHVLFNTALPTPGTGAELSFCDQVITVDFPDNEPIEKIVIDVGFEMNIIIDDIEERGGVAYSPLLLTLTGPGGLFPFDAGSTNAPISYTSDPVILGGDGFADTKLQYSRQFELGIATGLQTFFYLRPALIVEALPEGDGVPIESFTIELKYTVAYSIVPAPASCALAGLPRRRR